MFRAPGKAYEAHHQGHLWGFLTDSSGKADSLGATLPSDNAAVCSEANNGRRSDLMAVTERYGLMSDPVKYTGRLRK